MKCDVIILAGGLGTRLRSVVSDLPKPMAPVNGKPFMTYILERLDIYHVNAFIFSIGYLGEAVKKEFGDEYKGRPIIYCEENEPLGTGGGIKLALSHAQTERVLILNGDTFFDFDLSAFNAFHRATHSDLSIGLKRLETPDRYGTVEMEGDRITAFNEKQTGLDLGLINAGVYCINLEKLSDFPEDEKFSFETEILEKKVTSWKICGFVADGTFIDIGIPEDYERAAEIF